MMDAGWIDKPSEMQGLFDNIGIQAAQTFLADPAVRTAIDSIAAVAAQARANGPYAAQVLADVMVITGALRRIIEIIIPAVARELADGRTMDGIPARNHTAGNERADHGDDMD
jgi:hypothetical protein